MTAPTRRSSAGRAVVFAVVIPVVIAAVVVGIKFSTSVPAREAAQKGQKTLAALPDSSAVNSAAPAAVQESQEAVAGLPDSSAANSTAFAPVQAGKDSFGGLPPAAQATLRAARDFSRLSLEDMLKCFPSGLKKTLRAPGSSHPAIAERARKGRLWTGRKRKQ
jgi:hypothetical protein